jgi:hypothetical protein
MARGPFLWGDGFPSRAGLPPLVNLRFDYLTGVLEIGLVPRQKSPTCLP